MSGCEASASVTERSAVRVEAGRAEAVRDALAVEEPLEIRLVQGPAVRRLAVTMRTPGHDAELALGFLAGEGVIAGPHDVVDVAHAPLQGGRRDPNIVVVRLAEAVAFDARRLERHVYTTSSCGVCGKTSLEAVGAITGAPLAAGPTLSAPAVGRFPQALRAVQAGFARTGGLHAAALFQGERLVRAREDVGRHNALDKLVGSFLAAGESVPSASAVLLSGRASFELVQKALVAGISVVAAVGAPSSLAVDLADAHGMTLLGFVRDGRLTVYAGAGRIADA